ncbi:tRNA wybutosine-synthesizing protein 5-like [Centruroides sculpturatus]|uniref:tRNA wybutosine-synthesizing protein 5-like n=1 Tax=Centruroides sculpturatus TaxID=218467 RepID=UPI000C6E107E|nr:tRNA wybutosine-synthesizing protein 5-like [Centruroides sculpturatus]
MGNNNKREILIINNETTDSAFEYFTKEIYPRRIPVILRKFSIGSCINKWTPDYLSKQLGEHIVKVHVSTQERMDFIQKNFIYSDHKWHRGFIRNNLKKQTEMYYLRSLGENPRKDPANIQKQFPKIANDIEFPPFFQEQQFFSSVFRISSPKLCLWTHYDIMDNFLIQVTGHKRCVLFPPSDVLNLYLKGDKSEVLDIDNPDTKKYPNFKNVIWHECILQPGDILFIPALWFHNVTALSFSIAVNVFWKNLEDTYYDKKDIYGNKDLILANNAFDHLEKALRSIKDLPSDYRKFYACRLISKIQETLKETGNS